uniref:P/Homo B domain-containing protein n=1 Tax=Paramoeba aestuarina TaxID=180227 RepID=A0A7S4NNF6_9EUKA|mmetsp:Transcript_20455/g.31931  ORF Transcript_20455/g.31931 Transcript_20455/m.31931 type:complete len:509 (+) Transcript_20455:195-1721(+)
MASKREEPSLQSVVWMEKQVKKKRAKRTIPKSHRQQPQAKSLSLKDPEYEDQWHLTRIFAPDAWARGATGKYVQIAVVDDGMDWQNNDLLPNFNSQGSYDVVDGNSDPEPDSSDAHGTAVSGVVGGASNDFCGVGVAPEVKMGAVRILGDTELGDEEEGEALRYRYDLNYVFSNSWGPVDDGQTIEGPGRLTQLLMKNAVEHGRQGRGSVYVWAGGNGGEKGDNVNYDGFANSIFTIAVCAINDEDKRPSYSEYGACLICCAPSSSGTSGHKQIITTSLVTGDGCFAEFGGTSAAAPMVAGVVALMLDVRPSLTWRDVQGILVESSDIVDPHDDGWMTNDAGLLYNHAYGYGIVNANRAVETAISWDLYSPQIKMSTEVFDTSDRLIYPAVVLEDFYRFQVGEDIILEQIQIVFNCTATIRGDVVTSLISPTGMVSRLSEKHADGNPDYAWTFSSTAHWGGSSKGVWELQVRNAGSHTVALNSYQVFFYGRKEEEEGEERQRRGRERH